MGDLADRIRARRLELGLTQAELAARVGRAPSTVGAWEAGRSEPSDADVLETLTHVLDLDAIDAAEAADTAVADPAVPADTIDPDPALEVGPVDADTGDGEPNPPPVASEEETGPGTAEETTMQGTEPTTVVVARSRRVAQRLADRLGLPATVATVQPVRTDVDPMYRVRAVATAVVVGVLGLVFIWALGRFAAEFGAIFEAFLAPWR